MPTYGQLRATLEREGRVVESSDMVAAHARALGSILIANTRVWKDQETEDQGSGEAGHRLEAGKIQAIQHPSTRAMVPMARREPEGKA